MIVAFTVCANNYLPQAITLANSIGIHAPEWKFIIALVDKTQRIEGVVVPVTVEILPVDEIGLDQLVHMSAKYNIVELCTAVKPAFFQALFRRFPDAEQIHYLDPDTQVYGSVAPLEQALSQASILLTPHHFDPIPLDGLFPAENLALNHGVFNLGYLGLRRSEISAALLEWWRVRMVDYCVINLKEGWFVDQLFFNYVPIYFEEVKILRHPGVNVAFWNFHERRILSFAEITFRNQVWPLILFHFSGFSPRKPDQITRFPVRPGETPANVLERLLADYAQKLHENGYDQVKNITSVHQTEYEKTRKINEKQQSSLRFRLVKLAKKILR